MWGAIAAAGASFLGNVFGSAASGAGSAIGSGLAGQLFGNKRVSSSDAQHNEILLDRHQANQSQRDIQTAQDMMPTEIWQHNQFLDGTYSQDTARQDERMKTLFYDKGVSPWELAGSSAATPMPPGQATAGKPGGAGAPNPQALNSLTQLKATEMSNQTSLMQTAMQTKAQKEVAEKQNEPKHEANQINEFLATLREIDTMSLKEFRGNQTNLTRRSQNVQIMAKIVDLLPEEHLNTLFMKSSGKPGYQEAISALTMLGTTGGFGSDPQALFKNIPEPILKSMIAELRQASEGATMVGAGVAGLLGWTGVLNGIRGRKKKKKEPTAHTPMQKARQKKKSIFRVPWGRR